jgi:hypothetical protein
MELDKKKQAVLDRLTDVCRDYRRLGGSVKVAPLYSPPEQSEVVIVLRDTEVIVDESGARLVAK